MTEQTPTVGMSRKLAAIFSADVLATAVSWGTTKKPPSALSRPIER